MVVSKSPDASIAAITLVIYVATQTSSTIVTWAHFRVTGTQTKFIIIFHATLNALIKHAIRFIEP